MTSSTYWIHAWWAGFLVLMISVLMLGLCTFFEVKNPELIEIWKYVFLTSLGYVVGIPVGAKSISKTDSRIEEDGFES